MKRMMPTFFLVVAVLLSGCAGVSTQPDSNKAPLSTFNIQITSDPPGAEIWCIPEKQQSNKNNEAWGDFWNTGEPVLVGTTPYTNTAKVYRKGSMYQRNTWLYGDNVRSLFHYYKRTLFSGYSQQFGTYLNVSSNGNVSIRYILRKDSCSQIKQHLNLDSFQESYSIFLKLSRAEDNMYKRIGKRLLRYHHTLECYEPEPIVEASRSNDQPIKSKYEDFLNAVVVITSSDGIGTGFFISQNGFLITNAHVVGEDRKVSVKLKNLQTLMASVVSIDTNRDLALLKANHSAGSCLILGHPFDTKIGDDVIAIGTPKGLAWTVTKGIVSAIRVDEGVGIVQTDAPINTGNSGGPLISLKNGAVVGVNTFIYRKDISEGLNFAVSASEIKRAFPKLLQ